MSFKIIDDSTKKVVDEESSDYKAGRSLFILTAHERKNGRETKYSINPPVELLPWREYKLPSWAVSALTAAEHAAKAKEFLENTPNRFDALVTPMAEHIKDMITPKKDP